MTGVAALVAQANGGDVQLSLAGSVVMILSIVLVLALNVFCLYRISREPKPSEHHHAPLDIDTKDTP